MLLLVVTWREAEPSSPGGPKRRRSRTDPRDTLDASETVVYEALRAWRNERAQREGKPPFVLLTNKQIAAIARLSPSSSEELRAIEGVGPQRLTDLGDEILTVLRRTAAAAPHTPVEVDR